MNKTKQFWTLVKFQFLVNPAAWFLPPIIGAFSFFPFLTQGNSAHHSSLYDYHVDLSFYLYIGQSYFFVACFCSWIVAPEKFQLNRMKTAANHSGTEFLLTRAIDRPIFYRAKAFLLYALILLLPICTVIYFLRTPDLVVRENSKIVTQQVLDHVPGSVLSAVPSVSGLQPDIIIPHGSVSVVAWQVWVIILMILGRVFKMQKD